MEKWAKRGGWTECRGCGTTERKHRGRGFCARCYEKDLFKRKPSVKKKKLEKSNKWYSEKKDDPEQKAMRRIWSQNYLAKNRKIVNLLNKATAMRKRGKACMQIRIGGDIRYMPFETLNAKNDADYILLKEYYERIYETI